MRRQHADAAAARRRLDEHGDAKPPRLIVGKCSFFLADRETRVEAEDLMRFGLIPEFIGRVPVLATLEELDDMYGQQWPRGLTLAILLNHEIHHRAQMTVLMRQAGLVVPGVFGPSKEEWGEYGMNAPSY